MLNLDFVCLCIIAACGPKGIPQHDLVRISGQDKRSLPSRTDRLCKGGYILKKTVDLIISKALVHTSILIHTRFAESSDALVTELTEDAKNRRTGRKRDRRRAKANKDVTISNNNPENRGNGGLSNDPSLARSVAQWTPHRNILNQLFDAVDHFGLNGTASSDIMDILMGAEYRKPIDELLTKLTIAWQVSQPLHLRHLAIVRDSVQKNRNLVYVYYTWENFKKLVDAGKKTWEAIISLQDKEIAGNISISDGDQQLALDEYGFPELDPSQFVGQNNDGSLRDSVLAGAFSESRPKMTPKSVQGKKDTSLTEEGTPTKAKVPKPFTFMKAQGRPRKYNLNVIPANVETWDVKEIRYFLSSRKMAEKYERTKIKAEIDRRIEEEGESPHLVADQLLEEITSFRQHTLEEPLSNTVAMQIRQEYAGGDPPSEDPLVTTLNKIINDAVGNYHSPKRKRDKAAPRTPSKRAKLSSNGADAAGIPATPSAETQSPSDIIQDLTQPDGSEFKSSAKMIHDLMAEDYKKLVNSIPRPNQGVFIPQTRMRYNRQDDPPFMSKRNYQVAVFNLPALQNLDWFNTDSTMSRLDEGSYGGRQEHADASPFNANPSHQEPSHEIISESNRRSNRRVTKRAEIEASNDETARIPKVPANAPSGIDLQTQASDAVVLSEQQVEAVPASRQDLIVSTFDEPSSLKALPQDPDACEDVSIVSIVEPSSQVDQNGTQAVQKALEDVSPNNARDLDLNAQNLDMAYTQQNPREQVQDSVNGVSNLSPPEDLDSLSHNLHAVGNEASAIPHSQDLTSQVATKDAQAATEDQTRPKASLDENSVIETTPANITVITPKKKRKSIYHGGSTAILRRDIAIDIVKKNGGIFPEPRAMRIPFEEEWKVRGQDGIPDRNTIRKTVSLCCELGKLRRIVFSFDSKYGITATASVVTLPEIDPEDPRIAETQNLIKQLHPLPYVPVLFLDEREIKQQQVFLDAAERRVWVDEAKAVALKPQSERQAYLDTLQMSHRSDKEKRALAKLVGPSARKVERLISIRRPTKPVLQGQNQHNQISTQSGPRLHGAKRVTILEENDVSSGLFEDRNAGQTIYEYPFDSFDKHTEIHYVRPSFMNPVHIYHQPTGTFSSSFNGFWFGTKQRRKRKYTRKTMPPSYPPPPRPIAKKETMGFPGAISPGILHVPSGTFSAIFFGFSDIDLQIMKARYPRKAENLTIPKKRDANEVYLEDDERPSGRPKKKRQTDIITERREIEEKDDTTKPLIGNPVRIRRIRGPQPSGGLGEEGGLRLFVAVTAVRVLTGGMRKLIDWSLVTRAFPPEYDETFIRHRWSNVLTKMKRYQIQMDTDFQTLFLKGYEEGTVPTIDYDNLDKYDWKYLIDWTLKHLDSPAISAPHLLADRSAFDSRYSLTDASHEHDLVHYFEFEGLSVQDLRSTTINRQARTCLLFPNPPPTLHPPPQGPSPAEYTAISRTWIRANVATPSKTYDSFRARAKMSLLPPPAVEAALDSLLHDRIIVEKHRNRTISGRDYELSDFFEKRLRANMPPSQFDRAIAFKAQLDHAFASDGKARWNELAPDGEAMAVLNLVAHHRIKLVPVDPPLNKWGHIGEGYRTRQMDKSRMNFAMDLVPTASYIAGRPLEPLPPPPAPQIHPDGLPRRIPLWFDINDDFVPVMWRHALAAVLGLLAIRTGANAAELGVTMRPALEVWEVEEILVWMVRAGVAERVGKGYRVGEWWWMAHGGQEEVGGGDETGAGVVENENENVMVIDD